MRAMVMKSVVDSLDRPFLFDEEVADPVVDGPFDVLVEIVGAGVCRTDLEVLRGKLAVETPHILGHENSGRVCAVGVIGVGGLGHIAVQILKARSTNPVVALDRREEVRELALDSGADFFLLPSQMQGHDLGDVGAVVDFVGSSDSFSVATSLLAFGGSYVGVGVGGELAIPTFDLVTRELRIEGVYVGTYPELKELTALLVRGVISPRVVRYPLSGAESALRDLDEGSLLGRAVLVP